METTEMKYEVEVQAGKRVVDFVEELDRDHHKALKMMGNYAGQTVGGVASTSTHGSGWFSGTMVRLIEWSNKNSILQQGAPAATYVLGRLTEKQKKSICFEQNSNNCLMVEMFKKMAGRKRIDNFD